MKKYILGKKLGMTQIFDEKGKVQPVSLIEAGPCVVTQIIEKEKNTYSAVQIGFGEKKLNKPQTGHLKNLLPKGAKKGFAVLKEFRVEPGEVKTGDKILVSQFEKGDKVNVRSKTKGKGFQGVVKRWNFAGGPASHGQKHSLRAPGSIGSAYPQRVMKGKKMAGRMGGKTQTTRNLKVIDVLADKHILVLKGAVSGNNGSVVEVWQI